MGIDEQLRALRESSGHGMTTGTEITSEDVSSKFLETHPGFKASRGTVHPRVARQREREAEWDAKEAALRSERERESRISRHRAAAQAGQDQPSETTSNAPRFIRELLGPEGQARSEQAERVREINAIAARASAEAMQREIERLAQLRRDDTDPVSVEEAEDTGGSYAGGYTTQEEFHQDLGLPPKKKGQRLVQWRDEDTGEVHSKYVEGAT